MEQFFVGPEQRLSQISIDLLKRMAEVKKLRELIKAAEAEHVLHPFAQREQIIDRHTFPLALHDSSPTIMRCNDSPVYRRIMER